MFLILYLAKNMKGTSTNTGTSILESRQAGVLGSELQGKTITIIGLGATGLEVAKRAKSFGMHVLSVTKNPSLKKPEKEYFVDNIGGLETLSDSLARADYVSLHTPLTEETRSMIGKKELGLMKKSSFLINVARAPIVDREALFTELSSKKISGAAFDVFWEEPADSNDKLLKLDNFVLTPHIAGWTNESVDAIARIITTNIERISQAEVPLTIVNSELTY
jgi:D-3-phosphoglycerate dehydrogenase